MANPLGGAEAVLRRQRPGQPAAPAALTGAPFALADVLVIAIFGLVCFVPFALFARGLVRA